MIICICNNVSDKKVNQIIINQGISNVRELQQQIVICNQCKMCACDLKKMISSQQKSLLDTLKQNIVELTNVHPENENFELTI